MKQINVKLLVILVISAIVLLGGTKLLHDHQAVKGADSMLIRAEQAKDEGEYEQAVKLLQGYLSRRPDDKAQYANLALTMKQALEDAEKSGRPFDAKVFQRTYARIEDALRRAPEDQTLREAAIDFGMKFYRWTDAITHIQYLVSAASGDIDPALMLKLAVCQLRSGQEDKAMQTTADLVGFNVLTRTFEEGKATAPNHIEAYTFLANIYGQRKSRIDVAKTILDQLVAMNGDEPAAYRSRARFLGTNDKYKQLVERDVAKAMELAPDEVETLLLAGRFALNNKQYSHAKELYDKILGTEPNNVQAIVGLSLWGGATRDIDSAITYMTRAEELQPRNPAIVLQRANLLIEKGDFEEVEACVEKLRRLGGDRAFRDFLQGRVHLHRGEWLRAADKLTSARPQLVQKRPEWLTPVDSSLALCYENLSQHDRRKEAFQRILMREPSNMMARWGKIEALKALNQKDAALAEYSKLERQFQVQKTTAGRLLIPHLTLELMQQRDKPEDDRDWSEAEVLVRRILQETHINDAAKASVVAQYYTEIGEKEKAQTILDRAREKDPDNLVLKLAKIGDLATKDRPAARQALDEFQAENGDMYSVRILRAQLAMVERNEGFAAEIREQAENVSMFPEKHRLQLWARIGRMLIAAGDPKGARELWQKVAEAQPDNIQIRIGVFELALQDGDAASRGAALDQLRDLVGSNTSEMKWARAMEILWAVKREERSQSDLGEARGLIDDAISSRPGWEPLYRISGELALRENDSARALEAFQQAADLGTKNGEVFRNLARLNFAARDYQASRKSLDQLPRYMWSNSEQRMDLELLAREGNLPEEIAVNEDSENPGDHFFAGRVLASAGRMEESDAAYRRAIKLEPENPKYWGGLFNLYVDNKKMDAAQSILRDAESKLSESNAPVFLGTAYRKLGEWEKSESNYASAIAVQPDNMNILNALADMLLASKQVDKAKTNLEKMVSLADSAAPNDLKRVRWARRRLAGLVVSDGTYDGYKRALELLKANQGDSPSMSTQDLVMLGQLANRRRDSLSRQQAIAIIESVAKNRSLSHQARFQLAALFESEGRWSDCKSEMESLLVTVANPDALLDPWLDWLIRHDELDKAAMWLRKAPSGSPMAIRTKAHIDVDRGRSKQAVAAITRIVPKEFTPETAAQYFAVAGLAEELAKRDERIYKVADAIWAKCAKADPKNLVPYGKYLSRRNDSSMLDRALKVCDHLSKSGNIVPAIQIATTILRNDLCPERSKHGKAVRAWSDEAIQQNPEVSTLYIIRSELEDVLGDNGASEEWLRKFVELGKGSVTERGIVANNLAYKLALAGKGEEAIRLANESLNLLGPQDALKDTFGMSYLAVDDYAKAIEEFESAIGVSPSASKYYHLAMAKWRAGDRSGGAEAMELAVEMGVMKGLEDGPEADKATAFLKELQSAGVISTDPGKSDLDGSAVSGQPNTL